MGKSNKLPIAFVVVCNIIVFVFLVLPISGSEICKQQYHAGNENCTPYEVIAFYVALLADFLGRNEAAFTALFTLAVAVFTWRLYISTDGLLLAAGQESEHTRRSIDLLVADQRPWVSVNLSLSSGITQSINETIVTVLFTLRNTGKSPALNIFIYPELFSAFGEIDPLERQRAIVETLEHEDNPHGAFGHTLFPGDQLEIPFDLRFSEDDIERFPPIMILGCIDYRTVVDTQHHQTGFMLYLSRIEPQLPVVIPVPNGHEVPIADLTLTQSFMGSGYTN